MGFGNRGSFNKGGARGGGNFNYRGGRGGGNRDRHDQGPPSEIIEVGHFTHACENDLVCLTTCDKIPYFNAPVYFQNKEQIGKIDEIFGNVTENGFSVKLSEGVKAGSFKPDQKIYIESNKLLPVERFTNPQNERGRKRGGGGGGGRGGNRGGGNFNRGRGNNNNRSYGGDRNNSNSFRGNGRNNTNFGRSNFVKGRGGGNNNFKRQFDGNRSGGGNPNKRFKRE